MPLNPLRPYRDESLHRAVQRIGRILEQEEIAKRQRAAASRAPSPDLERSSPIEAGDSVVDFPKCVRIATIGNRCYYQCPGEENNWVIPLSAAGCPETLPYPIPEKWGGEKVGDLPLQYTPILPPIKDYEPGIPGGSGGRGGRAFPGGPRGGWKIP
jgi:hypothetical protein